MHVGMQLIDNVLIEGPSEACIGDGGVQKFKNPFFANKPFDTRVCICQSSKETYLRIVQQPRTPL